MKNRKNVIVCPYCGAEYLPQEIFTLDTSITNLGQLVKNDKGQIEWVEKDLEDDLQEEYVCDYCNKPFKVEANLTYTTIKEIPDDLDEEETETTISLF